MQEDQQVSLPDGRKLGYGDYGDPQGEPVFFFHGWPSSRFHGKMLDEGGRERGLRVIAPDRPGIGLSDPLPGRGFGSWPTDVAGLADALGMEKFRLFGISGGCPYTLATAAALPERVRAAAVMCGAPPLGSPADKAHMHWAYRSLAGLKALRRAVMPVFLGVSEWMVRRGSRRAPMSWVMHSIPPSDRSAIAGEGEWEEVTRSYLEAVRSGAPAVLADGELYLEPWDFEPEQIRVPVGFWHGTADSNLPCEVVKRLAGRVPGSVGHWIEGEGHYSLPIRYRDQVLDWLAAQP
jgi:pimeloyl-ACP methyl ester carboxylesterase